MYNEQLINIKKNINIRQMLIEIRSTLKSENDVNAFMECEQFDKDILPMLLTSEDAKIRKNAVLIMGQCQLPEYKKSIYDGYLKETTLFVKNSYLVALCNYDYSEYTQSLLERKKELESEKIEETNVKHIAEELHTLNKMFPDSTKHNKHKFKNPDKPVNVILTASKEMIPSLLTAVSETVGNQNTRKVFCGALALTDKIHDLSRIRIYKDMLFPLNGMKACEKSEIPVEIVNGNIFDILKNMSHDGDECFYFRLSGKNVDTQKIAMAIETLSGGRLVNSVSDYEVEIRLFGNKENRYAMMVKFYTYKETRFMYRQNHVAASMTPVNAASVVYLTREYMKKNAQILDPFCGVGTLLIERNKIVKAKFIYGIDTFAKAIEGAKANSAAAGVDINYIHRDYFDFTHEYEIDEIITDMPRVNEDVENFYRKFLDKSYEILCKDGIIILYCCEKSLVHRLVGKKYEIVREFQLNEKEGYFVAVLKKIGVI